MCFFCFYWVCFVCFGFSFRGMVLDVLSSLAIVLQMKNELVTLLELCCDCLCSVAFPKTVVGWSPAIDCGSS